MQSILTALTASSLFSFEEDESAGEVRSMPLSKSLQDSPCDWDDAEDERDGRELGDEEGCLTLIRMCGR